MFEVGNFPLSIIIKDFFRFANLTKLKILDDNNFQKNLFIGIYSII